VLYLGLPVIGVSSPGNTAYFSSTSFTATAGQTTFTPSGSYTPGFINVIRNGAQLAPANYTATNGTTVVLNNACTAGDIVVIEVYTLTSISNALPLTGGTVTGASTFNSTLTVNGAAVSGFTGFKNRIINGAMVIDQRSAGASVTVTGGSAYYSCDRWQEWQSQNSKYSIQRSTTAPTGFINSLLATSLSAYSVISSDSFALNQNIEGLNCADLAWGTASASTVTVSFWVRSSLTGTFGGALANSAVNRSYPFTYTISSANTFEYKTITIPGDTSGTWLTDNGIGIRLWFSIGAGSTYLGTAGSWAGADYRGATGQTSVVGTNGATFYITGVQLERGSNATSFEFRSYGQELALCQRYYYKTTIGRQGTGFAKTTTVAEIFVPFQVNMRVAPTALEQSGTASDYLLVYLNIAQACSAVPTFGTGATTNAAVNFTVSSGLTAGNGLLAGSNSASSYLAWSAEL
jgi:hypothetical protein